MNRKTFLGASWHLIKCGADSFMQLLKFVFYTVTCWTLYHMGYLCTKWKLNIAKSTKAWWASGKEDRKELWDWVVTNPVAVAGLIAGFFALSFIPFCIYEWTSWWWVIVLGTIAVICFLICYGMLGAALNRVVFLISWGLHLLLNTLGKTLSAIFADGSLGAYLLGVFLAMIFCTVGAVISTPPIGMYWFSAGVILAVISVLYLVYYCRSATTATPTKGKWALGGLGTVLFGVPLALFALGLIGMYNPYFFYTGVGGLLLIIGAMTFAIKDSMLP